MRAATLVVAVGLLGCPGRPGPARLCEVSPASLDFGEVSVILPGKSLRVVLMNQTEETQQVTVAPLEAPFSVHPSFPVELRPHGLQEVVVAFKPTDGRLHLADVVISSESGKCDLTVPVQGLGSGSLRAIPTVLNFALNKGESQTREVRIENTRRSSDAVELAVTPPASFSAPEGIELPAGGSIPVMVTARLDDWTVSRSVLIVTGAHEQLEVPIEVLPASPNVEVTPAPIDLAVVDLSSSAERLVRVRNSGASMDPNVPRLSVSTALAGHDDTMNEVVVTREPFKLLAEDEFTDLTLRFTPKVAGPHTFQLRLETNAGTFHFPGFANAVALPPCAMQVTPPDRLVLQEVPDGGLEGTVSFSNVGDTDCTVDAVQLSSPVPSGFSVSGAVKEQLRVPAMAQRQLTIAGPRQPDAGTLGAIRYLVFRKDTAVQTISLEAP